MQIVGNFFDMDIDDDCIPFKKEKNILKNELGKKTPNSFLNLRKELTQNICSVIIEISNLQIIESERSSIMGGLRTLVY